MTDLMTVKEMQAYLRISRAKAYELTKEKGFPTIRIGTTIRIPKDQLTDWVKGKVKEG